MLTAKLGHMLFFPPLVSLKEGSNPKDMAYLCIVYTIPRILYTVYCTGYCLECKV